jgi:Protein of unknown function (DUF4232)
MIVHNFLPRPRSSRLIAAAGAIVAVCTVAPAACAATRASSAPAVATCAGASDLHLRIAGSQYSRAAGITYYTLDFANTGGSDCSLSGYPYVSVVSRTGSQLGSPAGHGLMTIAPLVILAPGATAHTTLAYYGRRVGPERGCGPVAEAAKLRVYVAGHKLALYATVGWKACSHAGQVYLSVTQPFRKGKG